MDNSVDLLETGEGGENALTALKIEKTAKYLIIEILLMKYYNDVS